MLSPIHRNSEILLVLCCQIFLYWRWQFSFIRPWCSPVRSEDLSYLLCLALPLGSSFLLYHLIPINANDKSHTHTHTHTHTHMIHAFLFLHLNCSKFGPTILLWNHVLQLYTGPFFQLKTSDRLYFHLFRDMASQVAEW